MSLNYIVRNLSSNRLTFKYEKVNLYDGNIEWINGKNLFNTFPTFSIDEKSPDYILVDDETKTYYEKKLLIDSDGCDFEITITDNANINFDVFFPWVKHTSFKNKFTFHCDKNFLLENRKNKIIFYDKKNNNLLIINIIQENKNFSIDCNPDIIRFSSYTNNLPGKCERKTIEVDCRDGREDFIVHPPLEYISTNKRAKNINEDPLTISNLNEKSDQYVIYKNSLYELKNFTYNDELIFYYRACPDKKLYVIKNQFVYENVKYDNSINIKKIGKTKIEFTNFGRITNNYYNNIIFKVYLQHVDNVFNKKMITIEYQN